MKGDARRLVSPRFMALALVTGCGVMDCDPQEELEAD